MAARKGSAEWKGDLTLSNALSEASNPPAQLAGS